jgi:hypothetical protein
MSTPINKSEILALIQSKISEAVESLNLPSKKKFAKAVTKLSKKLVKKILKTYTKDNGTLLAKKSNAPKASKVKKTTEVVVLAK